MATGHLRKMTTEPKLSLLFERYMNGTSSPEETREFLELANDPGNEKQFKQIMDTYLLETEFSLGMTTDRQQAVFAEVTHAAQQADIAVDKYEEYTSPKPVQRKMTFANITPFWKKMAAAAAVLLIISVPSYLYVTRIRQQAPVYVTYKGDIGPGSHKAVLTLSDGSKLVLNEKKNGELARQQGVKVTKTADGKLCYQVMGNTAGSGLSYNTIVTPAGGQYQVILPDGTKVWLNALSSLKYPTSFASQPARKVFLSGEAYFEVAKVKQNDTRVPFIVSLKGEEVKVLGTHFNINSYPDEPGITTTLLEGSVSVSRSGVFDQLLKPGEQALVNTGISVREVDTTAVVAWKNGLFKFEKAGLTTMMNQLSRWYDVDIAYEGKVPKSTFSGELYRNTRVNKILLILNLSHIDYRIEAPENNNGRKRIVISGSKQ